MSEGKRGPGRPALYTEDERREKRRIKSRDWRKANLERSREITRECEKRRNAKKAVAEGREPGRIGRPAIPISDEERRAKHNARIKRWYRQNKEVAQAIGAAAARNRRARIRKVGGTHTTEDIAELRRRQKGKCAFCLKPFGKATPHVDHYVPLSRGGTNDSGNLRLLHQSCNARKHAKDPLEHALSHGLLCW